MTTLYVPISQVQILQIANKVQMFPQFLPPTVVVVINQFCWRKAMVVLKQNVLYNSWLLLVWPIFVLAKVDIYILQH